MNYDNFDVDKARELREKAKDSFLRQLRRDFIGTVVATVPFLVLVIFASAKWMSSAEPESRLPYSTLYLLGILFILTLWALQNLTARLLFLSKEIKQLRLDLLSLQESPLEKATGGAESFSKWTTQAVRPRVLVLLLLGVVVLALATSFTYNVVFVHCLRTFGGQEVVDVHFTPEGTIRACSRISITRVADNVSSMSIHIPKSGAELESVTIGGREIPFDPVPGQDDTYIVIPGLPENALKNALLEVVWTCPITDTCVTFPLQGVIPCSSYTLNAVFDEGAPYQHSGDLPYGKSFNMYWTTRPNGRYDNGPFGSCSMAIQPINNAVAEGVPR